MSIRTERVGGEVQQAIARLLQMEFTDITNGMLTVTKVRMAPDLRSARVYVSILGGTVKSDAVLKSLRTLAPQIRAGVGRAVRLRFTPELFFYIDDTQEEVQRVEEIFKRIGDQLRSNQAPANDEGAPAEDESAEGEESDNSSETPA